MPLDKRVPGHRVNVAAYDAQHGGVDDAEADWRANAVEIVFWLLVDVLAKRGAPCAS